jgi:hypothetical protein
LVEAPGTAPGSEELISTPFIAIAALGGNLNITWTTLFLKGMMERETVPTHFNTKRKTAARTRETIE